MSLEFDSMFWLSVLEIIFIWWSVFKMVFSGKIETYALYEKLLETSSDSVKRNWRTHEKLFVILCAGSTVSVKVAISFKVTW